MITLNTQTKRYGPQVMYYYNVLYNAWNFHYETVKKKSHSSGQKKKKNKIKSQVVKVTANRTGSYHNGQRDKRYDDVRTARLCDTFSSAISITTRQAEWRQLLLRNITVVI